MQTDSGSRTGAFIYMAFATVLLLVGFAFAYLTVIFIVGAPHLLGADPKGALICGVIAAAFFASGGCLFWAAFNEYLALGSS